MKYLVNFQADIELSSGKTYNTRSTFTIIENDIKNIPKNNFEMIKNWFEEYFHKNDLDQFVDASKINESYTVNLKIGRITNSIDGQYKTFRR